jgi:hypothetical protein
VEGKQLTYGIDDTFVLVGDVLRVRLLRFEPRNQTAQATFVNAYARFLLPFLRVKEGKRLMCEECAPSLIPDVAKAVKVDSAFHPWQNGKFCNALRRLASARIPSPPTFRRCWNFVVRSVSLCLP